MHDPPSSSCVNMVQLSQIQRNFCSEEIQTKYPVLCFLISCTTIYFKEKTFFVIVFPFPVYLCFYLQRAGAQEIYGKVPRGPSLGPRPGMEEMDFSDDDATPLTEPIYSGR